MLYPDPEAKNELVTYKKAMATIKHAINLGSPLIIELECSYKKKGAKSCDLDASHSFVIYGYAKLCEPSGACQYGLRLRNSRGQKQDALDRELWYSAEDLIAGRGKKGQLLGWLEPRKPKDYTKQQV